MSVKNFFLFLLLSTTNLFICNELEPNETENLGVFDIVNTLNKHAVANSEGHLTLSEDPGQLSTISIESPSKLSEFDFKSASVLPLYVDENEEYVLLSQEKGGQDKGTFDDFGGKRDPGEDDPIISAAREFFEEGIVMYTMKLTLKQTEDFIDSNKSNNTQFVIANSTQKGAKHVTYITKMNDQLPYFIDNFYTALTKVKSPKYREKSALAIVQLHDLRQVAINQQDGYSNLWVKGEVIDPKTGDRQAPTMIKLRPYFIVKLQKFLKNEPYTQGENEKIRFYENPTKTDLHLDQ